MPACHVLGIIGGTPVVALILKDVWCKFNVTDNAMFHTCVSSFSISPQVDRCIASYAKLLSFHLVKVTLQLASQWM